MITFIQTILLSQIPNVPSAPIGPPRPPGVPIDNGLIFLFCIAIFYGTYTLYRKEIKKKKINTKAL